MNGWVVCRKGKGFLYKNNAQEKLETNFDKDAIGLIKEDKEDNVLVWLIGIDSDFVVPKSDVEEINGENYLMNAVNYIKDHDVLR